MYSRFLKKYIDITAAFFGLLLLTPILVVLIIILYIANKGSVFFTQARPGKNGKIFKVIKFKTMTDERDKKGDLLTDDKRLTKIGKFVRSTSLDELPQLFNVLKGDMSLIGPRPLLPEYLPLYSKEQQRRHEVRPGITGWAQVNGRNAISWQQKFKYDVWYVDHLSFLLDVNILFKTVRKVIARHDINATTAIPMTLFTGNPSLVVYGVSGHAKVVLDIMSKLNMKPDYLIDDYTTLTKLFDYPIKKNLTHEYEQMVIAIGDCSIRKMIAESNSVKEFLTIIDPSCIISHQCKIGEGSVIMPQVVINSSVTIGSHCIINTSAVIEHDCAVGDYVHISPGAILCGNVTIGEGSWIGAGTVIKQGVCIGKNSIIGAGSVVISDIPDSVVAVGNKCVIIKKINNK